MNKYTKIGLMLVICGAILGTLHTFLFIPEIKKRSVVEKNLRDQINATCRVKTKGSRWRNPMWGSGVELNTGYVLTAAHVIDTNRDGILDIDEREVGLEYFGDVADTTSATVAYFDNDRDIAFLHPTKTFGSVVGASKVQGLLGEKIFTIGSMRRQRPMITSGYIGATEENGYYRASCYVTGGSSGGGLFKESTKELVGVVNTLQLKRRSFSLTIPLPSSGGTFRLLHTRPIYTIEMNSMAGFVPIQAIRSDLVAANKLYLLEQLPQPGVFDNPVNLAIIKTVFQTLLIIMSAYVARKYLFPA